jgi:alkylhydroperoxidase family enzyme
VSDEKIDALGDYAASHLFDERERAALAYADAMTTTPADVSDDVFARVRESFDDDAIVELTEIIAWENASARFNRALRVPSQGLYVRRPSPGASRDPLPEGEG